MIGFALLFMAACNFSTGQSAQTDVTLEPSRVAAMMYVPITPTVTLTKPAPEPVMLSGDSPVVVSTPQSDQPVATEDVATQEEAPTDIPTPEPTSNHEELAALRDNPNLEIAVQMDEQCFLENDFIPFNLTVTSRETDSIYFYRHGRWLLSINNSPAGPQLASMEPTIRDDFIDLTPNETYTQEEEDLGLWVLSLGPESGIPFTPTGIGLPAGDYWVTFLYTNDQDGLKEQPDGTYLIEKTAWRGTVVTPEIRLKVVDDLSKC